MGVHVFGEETCFSLHVFVHVFDVFALLTCQILFASVLSVYLAVDLRESALIRAGTFKFNVLGDVP